VTRRWETTHRASVKAAAGCGEWFTATRAGRATPARATAWRPPGQPHDGLDSRTEQRRNQPVSLVEGADDLRDPRAEGQQVPHTLCRPPAGAEPTPSPELQAARRAEAITEEADLLRPSVPLGPAQWLVLLTCRDEQHQVELLARFQAEGLPCRSLLS
jgi:hypothetical protein